MWNTTMEVNHLETVDSQTSPSHPKSHKLNAHRTVQQTACANCLEPRMFQDILRFRCWRWIVLRHHGMSSAPGDPECISTSISWASFHAARVSKDWFSLVDVRILGPHWFMVRSFKTKVRCKKVGKLYKFIIFHQSETRSSWKGYLWRCRPKGAQSSITVFHSSWPTGHVWSYRVLALRLNNLVYLGLFPRFDSSGNWWYA